MSLTAALLSFAVFRLAMAYPWQLAILTATAIGALVYSAQTTWKRLRRLYRPPEAPELTFGGSARGSRGATSGIIAGRRLAPGEEGQGEHEQQVQPSAQDESRQEQDHPAREQRTGQE